VPVRTVTPSPPVASYIQWTGDNLDAVQQFCEIVNVNLNTINGELFLYYGTSGQRPLPLNCWVIQRHDPDLPVWFPDEDTPRYQEVPQAQGYTYDITGS
jgi:hypothetical protein